MKIEKKKIDIKSKIYYVDDYRNFCEHSNYVKVLVNLLNSENKYEKVLINFCDKCNKIFILSNELKRFKNQFPKYTYKKYVKTISKKEKNKLEWEKELKKYDFIEHPELIVISKFTEHKCLKNKRKPEHNNYRFVTYDKEGKKVIILVYKCDKCGEMLISNSAYKIYSQKLKNAKFFIYNIKKKETKKEDKVPNIEHKANIEFDLEKDVLFKGNCNHITMLEKYNLSFPFSYEKANVDRIIPIYYCDICNRFYITIDDFKKYKLINYEPLFKTSYKQKIQSLNLNYNDKIKNSFKSKKDFILRTHSLSCSYKNHKLEDILCSVKVLTYSGEIVEMDFDAVYCWNCNMYYMLNKEYDKLIKHGIPLCSIYEENKIMNNKNFQMNTESQLHSYGYNVSSIDNYTTLFRQNLLESIIKLGFMTKYEIKSHINYLYSSRKNNRSYKKACEKWKSDLMFLDSLHIANKTIKVDSFRIVKYYRK